MRTTQVILVAAALAAVIAAYMRGGADNEAKHTQAALAQEHANAAAATKLAAVEEANRMLSRALEDAAYAEPPTANCGLPAARVLRLNSR